MDPPKEKLNNLLEAHLDSFSCGMNDLPSVYPSIFTHKVNVISGSKTVEKEKRAIASVRETFVKDEVQNVAC